MAKRAAGGPPWEAPPAARLPTMLRTATGQLGKLKSSMRNLDGHLTRRHLSGAIAPDRTGAGAQHAQVAPAPKEDLVEDFNE